MELFTLATDKPIKSGDVYTFNNGATYRGGIRNGKMHGKGTYEDASGASYVGDWHEGTMHGHGVSTSPDGESYKGQYYQGLPHGRGIYTFENGNVYEGDYNQGKIHGFGVIKFPDKRRFEGQFKDNKKNGKGKYEGANGVYEGNYVDGKKDGLGKFTWIDCSWYDGEWKGDFMHGTGTKREKDGRLFEVVYEMGKVQSATPCKDPSNSSASISSSGMRGGLDRPFSHVPLPSSIGARSRPGQAPVSFSGGDDDDEDNDLGGYDSMEARMVVEAEEGDEGGGGPAAWLKERWQDVTEVLSCGGARETIHKRGREMCGAGWDTIESVDCGKGPGKSY